MVVVVVVFVLVFVGCARFKSNRKVVCVCALRASCCECSLPVVARRELCSFLTSGSH